MIDISIFCLGQPFHLLDLFGRRALGRLHAQDLAHEVHELLVFCLLELDLAAVHESFQLVVGLGLEGVAAFCEGVHDYAVGPDVCLLALVLSSADDFWSHVVGRAADDCQFLVFMR